MKVQVSDNDIRFRLSVTDFDVLLSKSRVEFYNELLSSRFVVMVSNTVDLSSSAEDGSFDLTLMVTSSDVSQLKKLRDEGAKDGLVFDIDGLVCSVDVDVKESRKK